MEKLLRQQVMQLAGELGDVSEYDLSGVDLRDLEFIAVSFKSCNLQGQIFVNTYSINPQIL